MAMKLPAADQEANQDSLGERKNPRFRQRRRVLRLGPIAVLLALAGCQVKIRSPDLLRYDKPDPGP